jgi:ubiquitin-conjugating enzyme E2 Z
MSSEENTNGSTSCVITKTTIKRLVSDIKELKKNSLIDHGIHYIHDENDMLKGYAVIIGPKNTPYEGGYYIFKFIFPSNYPHSPPVVEYLTNDGETRFNPNLYKNGKVCISILNTWEGEPWSGCQTISSVLLSICSVLNETPLMNEPGLTKKHPDYNSYNEIIRYKNFEIAMCRIINNDYVKQNLKDIYQIIISDFIENFDKKIELLYKASSLFNEFKKKNYTVFSGEILRTKVYSLQCKVDYNYLANLMSETLEYTKQV